ncbi:hypothetical protein ABPG75_012556 [Micractinium tetrahymenae]
MADESDAAQQADELCALQAIYGEEAVRVLEVGPGAAAYAFSVPDAGSQPRLEVRAHLPATYPSQHPPIVELQCGLLPPDVLAGLAAELEGMFVPGEVALWNWLEHLRERWADLAPQQQAAAGDSSEAAAGSGGDADAALAAELQAAELLGNEAGEGGGRQAAQQRQQREGDAELEAALAEVVDTVVHGEPFTEKRSTFQAHLAPASSMQHVEALMELLLQNNKIRAATHNIMAFRIEQAERGTFLQDYDDDGETAAGGRLLHLLQMVDARNVCVVVSRWYGGILLGPARFTHINNAAREVLDACGYIAGKESSGKGSSSSSSKGKKR